MQRRQRGQKQRISSYRSPSRLQKLILVSLGTLAIPSDNSDFEHGRYRHDNCLDESSVAKILDNWITIYNIDPATPAYAALVDATVRPNLEHLPIRT